MSLAADSSLSPDQAAKIRAVGAGRLKKGGSQGIQHPSRLSQSGGIIPPFLNRWKATELRLFKGKNECTETGCFCQPPSQMFFDLSLFGKPPLLELGEDQFARHGHLETPA